MPKSKRAKLPKGRPPGTDHLVTCDECNGRGYCPECDGWKIDEDGDECWQCDGTGLCVECGGYGKVPDWERTAEEKRTTR